MNKKTPSHKKRTPTPNTEKHTTNKKTITQTKQETNNKRISHNTTELIRIRRLGIIPTH